MTQPEIDALLEYCDRLWPGNELTEEVRTLIGERLERVGVELEQARAAIGEYRVHCRFRTPDVGALFKAIQSACGTLPAVADVANMPEWERWRYMARMPSGYDTETVIAVWHWRIWRRVAFQDASHDYALGCLFTNYCLSCAEAFGWNRTYAVRMAERRWGQIPREADEWLAKNWTTLTAGFSGCAATA